jgi:hypothetical protein
MHRRDLIEQIAALAEQAEQGGEHDTAIVLFLLTLALGEGHDAAFAHYCAQYTPPQPPLAQATTA